MSEFSSAARELLTTFDKTLHPKAKSSALIPSGTAVSVVRCPSCGSKMLERRCYKCKFCGVCGSRWEGASCQNCFPDVPAYSSNDSSSVEGEGALETRDMSKLLGRNITTTEHNLLKAAFFDGSRARIHEMVVNAVSTWTIPDGTKKRIAESVTMRISKELRHGDPKVKPLLACLLREEAATLGLDMLEVTRALAVMGLNGNMHLRQASQWLIIASLGSSSSFEVYVGGAVRGTKTSRITERKERWSSWLEADGHPRDSGIFRTRVPIYLSDAIDAVTEIKVHGGVILEYSRKNHAALIDQSTLRIRVDYERSFYIFKSLKKVLLDQDVSCSIQLDRASYARKFMLDKGRCPLSSQLAKTSGCSLAINRLFLQKFKDKKSEGRAWKTVALEALRETDEEVFLSLPRLKKGMVLMVLRDLMKTTGKKLTRRDLEHTGVKGVLVLSEFEDDELKVN